MNDFRHGQGRKHRLTTVLAICVLARANGQPRPQQNLAIRSKAIASPARCPRRLAQGSRALRNPVLRHYPPDNGEYGSGNLANDSHSLGDNAVDSKSLGNASCRLPNRQKKPLPRRRTYHNAKFAEQSRRVTHPKYIDLSRLIQEQRQTENVLDHKLHRSKRQTLILSPLVIEAIRNRKTFEFDSARANR